MDLLGNYIKNITQLAGEQCAPPRSAPSRRSLLVLHEPGSWAAREFRKGHRRGWKDVHLCGEGLVPFDKPPKILSRLACPCSRVTGILLSLPGRAPEPLRGSLRPWKAGICLESSLADT